MAAWRIMKNFTRYEVSDTGQIRHIKTRRLRKFYTTPKGYLCLGIYDDVGKRVTMRVHHAVLTNFIGACPIGYVGCHNDGNSRNNILSNLRWDTCKNNTSDMIKHGTRNAPKGEAHSCAKLTQEEVNEIRQKCIPHHRKYGMSNLGKEYRVAAGTIREIVRFRNWKP